MSEKESSTVVFLRHSLFCRMVATVVIVSFPMQGVAQTMIEVDRRTKTFLNRSGDTTTVTTETFSQGNAINAFTRFGVDRGKTVNLVQPDEAASLINIVTGSHRSYLDGTLNTFHKGATGGRVILANTNGVVVGSDGVVNTGHLRMTTPSRAFTDGFFGEDGAVNEASLGKILRGDHDREGGSDIVIKGEVYAEALAIESGRDLKVEGTIYSKFGSMSFDRGEVGDADDFVMSVDEEGTVRLSSRRDIDIVGEVKAEREGGKGGEVRVEAGRDVDVRGGVDVSAKGWGEGGKIIVLAGRDARLAREGVLKAFADSGDGGFIEFSAKKHVDFSGRMEAFSRRGEAGTIYIDPETVEVSTSSTHMANYVVEASRSIRVKEGVSISSGGGHISLLSPMIIFDKGASILSGGGNINVVAKSVSDDNFHHDQSVIIMNGLSNKKVVLDAGVGKVRVIASPVLSADLVTELVQDFGSAADQTTIERWEEKLGEKNDGLRGSGILVKEATIDGGNVLISAEVSADDSVDNFALSGGLRSAFVALEETEINVGSGGEIEVMAKAERFNGYYHSVEKEGGSLSLTLARVFVNNSKLEAPDGSIKVKAEAYETNLEIRHDAEDGGGPIRLRMSIPTNFSFPDLSLPSFDGFNIKLPNFALNWPKFTLPGVGLPDISFPSIGVDFPTIKLPEIVLPNVPDISVPLLAPVSEVKIVGSTVGSTRLAGDEIEIKSDATAAFVTPDDDVGMVANFSLIRSDVSSQVWLGDEGSTLSTEIVATKKVTIESKAEEVNDVSFGTESFGNVALGLLISKRDLRNEVVIGEDASVSGGTGVSVKAETHKDIVLANEIEPPGGKTGQFNATLTFASGTSHTEARVGGNVISNSGKIDIGSRTVYKNYKVYSIVDNSETLLDKVKDKIKEKLISLKVKNKAGQGFSKNILDLVLGVNSDGLTGTLLDRFKSSVHDSFVAPNMTLSLNAALALNVTREDDTTLVKVTAERVESGDDLNIEAKTYYYDPDEVPSGFSSPIRMRAEAVLVDIDDSKKRSVVYAGAYNFFEQKTEVFIGDGGARETKLKARNDVSIGAGAEFYDVIRKAFSNIADAGEYFRDKYNDGIDVVSQIEADVSPDSHGVTLEIEMPSIELDMDEFKPQASFTTHTRALAGPSKKEALTINSSYFDVTGVVRTVVEKNVEIEAEMGSLDLEARNDVVLTRISNFSLSLLDPSAVGGSIVASDVESKVKLEVGGKLKAGGEMKLRSLNRGRNVGAGKTLGRSDKFSINGSFSFNTRDAQTVVELGGGVILEGDKVLIEASDSMDTVAIAGTVSSSKRGASVGVGYAHNDMASETKVVLGAEGGSEVELKVSDVELVAKNEEMVLAFGIAGSLSSGSLALAGSTSVNRLRKVYTEVDVVGVRVLSGRNFNISAQNESFLMTLAGSLGFSSRGVALAGGVATTLSEDFLTRVRIRDSIVSVSDVFHVETLQKLRAYQIVVGGSVSRQNVSVSGSVGVSIFRGSTESIVEENEKIEADKIEIGAKDEANVNTIAGAVSISGGSGSLGAGVSHNTLASNVKAEVRDTGVKANSLKIAGGQEGVYRSLVAAGALGKRVGIAGAVGINDVGGRLETRLSGGRVEVRDDVIMESTKDNRIDTLSGGAAGGKAGIAGAVSVNFIHDSEGTYLEVDEDFKAGSLTVRSTNMSRIRAAALSVGVGGNFGFAGSVAYSQIGTWSEGTDKSIVKQVALERKVGLEGLEDKIESVVTIKGALLSVERGSVEVEASDFSLIQSLSGGAAGGGAGVGVGVSVNEISGEVRAFVENRGGGKFKVSDDIRVEAVRGSTIESWSIALSLAGQIAVGGSLSLNRVKGGVKASIEGGEVEGRTVEVRAKGESKVNTKAGSVSGSGGALAAGVSVTHNTIESQVEAAVRDTMLKATNLVIEGEDRSSIRSWVVAGSGGGHTSIAGAIGVNDMRGRLESWLVGGSIDVGGEVRVASMKENSIETLSGGVAGGGSALAGAVSVNLIRDTVGSFVEVDGSFETGTLKITSDNASIIEGKAFSVGVGGNLGFAGSLVYSQIGTWREGETRRGYGSKKDKEVVTGVGNARGLSLRGGEDVIEAKLTLKGGDFLVKGGSVEVVAKDSLMIESLSGGVAASLSGGIGLGISVNEYSSKVRASIRSEGSNEIRLENVDDKIDVEAVGDAKVVTKSAGLGGGGALGLGGSISINRMGGEAQASLEGGILRVRDKDDASLKAGKIELKAENKGEIESFAGGLGIGVKVGIGGAVAVNEMGNKATTVLSLEEVSGNSLGMNSLVEGKLESLGLVGAFGGTVGFAGIVTLNEMKGESLVEVGGKEALFESDIVLNASHRTVVMRESDSFAVGGVAVSGQWHRDENDAKVRVGIGGEVRSTRGEIKAGAMDGVSFSNRGRALSAGVVAGSGLLLEVMKTTDVSVRVVEGSKLRAEKSIELTSKSEGDLTVETIAVSLGGVAVGVSLAKLENRSSVKTVIGEGVFLEAGKRVEILSELGGENEVTVRAVAAGIVAGSGLKAELISSYDVETDVGENVEVKGESIRIRSKSDDESTVRGVGVSGGIVAAGGLIVYAGGGGRESTTKTRIGRGTSLKALRTSADADIDVEALLERRWDLQGEVGSGGLFSGQVSGTRIVSRAGASVVFEEGVKLERLEGEDLAPHVRIRSSLRKDFASMMDNLNVSLAGGSGAHSSIDSRGDSRIIFGRGVGIDGGRVSILARNDAEESTSGDNLKSQAFGGFQASSSGSRMDVNNTTRIVIGEGFVLMSQHATDIGIKNDVSGSIETEVDAGAVGAYARAEAKIFVRQDNLIDVKGGGSKFAVGSRFDSSEFEGTRFRVSDLGHDLTLFIRSDANIKADSESTTYGLAGSASGYSRATFESVDRIDIGDADILAYGDVHVVSGGSREGVSNIRVEALTDVYNNTAIPFSTDPGADARSDVRRSVNVSEGAKIRAVRNVNVHAARRGNYVRGEGEGTDAWREALASVLNFFCGDCVSFKTRSGSNEDNIFSEANVDGFLLAGALNEQILKINEEGEEDTTTKFDGEYEVTSWDMRKRLDDKIAKLEALLPLKNQGDESFGSDLRESIENLEMKNGDDVDNFEWIESIYNALGSGGKYELSYGALTGLASAKANIGNMKDTIQDVKVHAKVPSGDSVAYKRAQKYWKDESSGLDRKQLDSDLASAKENKKTFEYLKVLESEIDVLEGEIRDGKSKAGVTLTLAEVTMRKADRDVKLKALLEDLSDKKGEMTIRKDLFVSNKYSEQVLSEVELRQEDIRREIEASPPNVLLLRATIDEIKKKRDDLVAGREDRVIDVRSVVASEGNVSIESEIFGGNGKLEARGGTRVRIENESASLIKVGRIFVSDYEGGRITYNDGEAIASTLTVEERQGSEGDRSRIEIINGYSPSSTEKILGDVMFEDDSRVVGSRSEVKVYARGGDINVYGGQISGLNLDIRAPRGEFFQAYSPVDDESKGSDRSERDKVVFTLSDPQSYFQNFVDSGVGSAEIADIPASYFGSKESPSKISAGRGVTIFSQYININGEIEAGASEYEVKLGEGFDAALDAYLASGGLSGGEGVIYDVNDLSNYGMVGSQVQVKGNVVISYKAEAGGEGRLVFDEVAMGGGRIKLIGHIMNTGNFTLENKSQGDFSGVLRVHDGYGRMKVDSRHSKRDLVFNAIGLGGEYSEGRMRGVIEITDLSKLENNRPTTVRYTYDDGKIYKTDLSLLSEEGEALNREIFEGRSTQYEVSKQYAYYREDGVLGNEDQFFSGVASNSVKGYYQVIVGSELREDEAYKYVSEEEEYWNYFWKELASNYFPDLEGREKKSEGVSVGPHRFKADYPITIDFAGFDNFEDHKVEVEAQGSVFFEKGFATHNVMKVHSLKGDVRLREGEVLRVKDLEIESLKGSVGGFGEIEDAGQGGVDVMGIAQREGGLLNVGAKKNIRIANQLGGLSIGKVHSEARHEEARAGSDLISDNDFRDWGNVMLRSVGSIVQEGEGSSVKGLSVHLESQEGSIGEGEGRPVVILKPEGTLGEEGVFVKVLSKKDIHLEVHTNLHAEKIESEAGSVGLHVKGSKSHRIYDKNESGFSNRRTVGELRQHWKDIGLTDDQKVKERILVGLHPEYRSYWKKRRESGGGAVKFAVLSDEMESLEEGLNASGMTLGGYIEEKEELYRKWNSHDTERSASMFYEVSEAEVMRTKWREESLLFAVNRSATYTSLVGVKTEVEDANIKAAKDVSIRGTDVLGKEVRIAVGGYGEDLVYEGSIDEEGGLAIGKKETENFDAGKLEENAKDLLEKEGIREGDFGYQDAFDVKKKELSSRVDKLYTSLLLAGPGDVRKGEKEGEFVITQRDDVDIDAGGKVDINAGVSSSSSEGFDIFINSPRGELKIGDVRADGDVQIKSSDSIVSHGEGGGKVEARGRLRLEISSGSIGRESSPLMVDASRIVGRANGEGGSIFLRSMNDLEVGWLSSYDLVSVEARNIYGSQDADIVGRGDNANLTASRFLLKATGEEGRVGIKGVPIVISQREGTLIVKKGEVEGEEVYLRAPFEVIKLNVGVAEVDARGGYFRLLEGKARKRVRLETDKLSVLVENRRLFSSASLGVTVNAFTNDEDDFRVEFADKGVIKIESFIALSTGNYRYLSTSNGTLSGDIARSSSSRNFLVRFEDFDNVWGRDWTKSLDVCAFRNESSRCVSWQ